MNAPAPLPPKRLSTGLKILIAIAAVVLLFGGLWWWTNRPIQPVQLTAQEQTVVEAKIEAIQAAKPATAASPAEPVYERGKKEIVLTERELNGLLNANTALGKTLSFQLGTDTVLARIETDLDPDLPLLGGKRLKARARFIVSESPGLPALIIDDLTIWGISLPNEWLGGLKGRNLLSEMLGTGPQGKFPGVESFAVTPGKMTIKLAE